MNGIPKCGSQRERPSSACGMIGHCEPEAGVSLDIILVAQTHAKRHLSPGIGGQLVGSKGPTDLVDQEGRSPEPRMSSHFTERCNQTEVLSPGSFLFT